MVRARPVRPAQPDLAGRRTRPRGRTAAARTAGGMGEHPEVGRFTGSGNCRRATAGAVPRSPATDHRGLEEAGRRGRTSARPIRVRSHTARNNRASSPVAAWCTTSPRRGAAVGVREPLANGAPRARGSRRRRPDVGRGVCRVRAREERVFLGDSSFYAACGGSTWPPRRSSPRRRSTAHRTHCGQAASTLTDFGRRGVVRAEDHARVNGLDRWVGGVHVPALRHAGAWRGG